MLRSWPRRPRPGDNKLRPMSAWLLVVAVVVIVAVTWPLTAWLLYVAGEDPGRQIDAIRTGLAAAAGTGGALALLLAFRRQRTTELIAAEAQAATDREERHRERAALFTESDAIERRITDLYARAAEQLGSDKAPVRLAALYALERLGQDSVAQRQTVVSLVCAYLRMPCRSGLDQVPDVPESGGGNGPEHQSEEREVRLAAQRVLQGHLRNHQGRSDDSEQDPRFWPGMHVNLSGAFLEDLDFSFADLGSCFFTGAHLSGNADFRHARFRAEAGFDSVRFDGWYTWFTGVRFYGEVDFADSEFRGNGNFNLTTFESDCSFAATRFLSGAWFRGARFQDRAFFSAVLFQEGVDFQSAFFEHAVLEGATFGGAAQFDDLTVGSRACQPGNPDLTASRAVQGLDHHWPEGWTTDGNDSDWAKLVMR